MQAPPRLKSSLVTFETARPWACMSPMLNASLRCSNGVIDKKELKHLLECVDNGNSCDVSVRTF